MYITIPLIFLNFYLLFFFNDTATTEIYTLSLHDALPICRPVKWGAARARSSATPGVSATAVLDRKSTRLNSSHTVISYAVFCLKKKKKHEREYVGDIKHNQRTLTNQL